MIKPKMNIFSPWNRLDSRLHGASAGAYQPIYRRVKRHRSVKKRIRWWHFFLPAPLVVVMIIASHFFNGPAPIHAKAITDGRTSRQCTYFMCEFEKSNIDTIILEHAKTCQSIMFGEIHDNALADMPAPVQDSIYVVTLLGRLKKIGYDYLALEVNESAPAGTHSNDMVRFCRSYHRGQAVQAEQFPHVKPGWIELTRRAIDLDYAIRFIDAGQRNGFANFPRDKAMYEAIKREVFDTHRDAKVIVYIGAFHVGERETETGVFSGTGKKKPLGFFLDQHTRGKNFSVYMGHPDDTPVGCDLFISYFIWDADQSGADLPQKTE